MKSVKQQRSLIMFLDKGATLVVTDIASSYIVATDVAGRTLGHLKASLDQALRGWDFNRATLRLIKSDRVASGNSEYSSVCKLVTL